MCGFRGFHKCSGGRDKDLLVSAKYLSCIHVVCITNYQKKMKMILRDIAILGVAKAQGAPLVSQGSASTLLKMPSKFLAAFEGVVYDFNFFVGVENDHGEAEARAGKVENKIETKCCQGQGGKTE
jgi:hypothetical protein